MRAARPAGPRAAGRNPDYRPNYGRDYSERFFQSYALLGPPVTRSRTCRFLLAGFEQRLDLFQPDRIHPHRAGPGVDAGQRLAAAADDAPAAGQPERGSEDHCFATAALADLAQFDTIIDTRQRVGVRDRSSAPGAVNYPVLTDAERGRSRNALPAGRFRSTRAPPRGRFAGRRQTSRGI